jgi:hypothetical protein
MAWSVTVTAWSTPGARRAGPRRPQSTWSSDNRSDAVTPWYDGCSRVSSESCATCYGDCHQVRSDSRRARSPRPLPGHHDDRVLPLDRPRHSPATRTRRLCAGWLRGRRDDIVTTVSRGWPPSRFQVSPSESRSRCLVPLCVSEQASDAP